MSKKMYQRPDGLYEVIRIVNGKRKAFRGRTPTEVNRKLLDYKGDIDQGPLFEVAGDSWWGEIVDRLSPNSLKCYRPAYKEVSAQFQGKRIKSITTTQIKSYFNDCAKLGLARKTISTRRIILNGIFKKAQEDYNFEFNPVAVTALPKNLPQSHRGPPSDDDVLRAEQNVESPFGLFAFVAMYTGLRFGELLALQGQDINRKSNVICVTKSIYYVGNAPHVKSPKTEAGTREVILLDVLSSHLPTLEPDQYLFSKDGGKTPLTHSAFDDLWKAYQIRTGISATPHQFRHLYATILYEAGIPVKDAQLLLGHAQAATTADIYTHIRERQIKKTAAQLNEYTLAKPPQTEN